MKTRGQRAAPFWYRIAAILKASPDQWHPISALIEILYGDEEADYAYGNITASVVLARRRGVPIETRYRTGYRIRSDVVL